VEFQFDPGALLGRFYPLEDGSRVGLRIARSSDVAPIRELFARRPPVDTAPEAVSDLEVARLVSFDPHRRSVICATALVDGGERVIGVGSIRIDEGPGGADVEPEPEIVLVDPEAPAGVDALLGGALVGRALALTQSRAA
jgi:hypothetical protein